MVLKCLTTSRKLQEGQVTDSALPKYRQQLASNRLPNNELLLGGLAVLRP